MDVATVISYGIYRLCCWARQYLAFSLHRRGEWRCSFSDRILARGILHRRATFDRRGAITAIVVSGQLFNERTNTQLERIIKGL